MLLTMPVGRAVHERRGRSILLMLLHHVAPKRRVPPDGTGPSMIGGFARLPAGPRHGYSRRSH